MDLKEGMEITYIWLKQSDKNSQKIQGVYAEFEKIVKKYKLNNVCKNILLSLEKGR